LQKPQGIIWPQCSGEQPARQRGLAYGLRERMVVGGATASVVVASKARCRLPLRWGARKHASSGGRCRGSFVPLALTRGRDGGPWRSRPSPAPVGGDRGGDRRHQQFKTHSAVHGGQCRWPRAPSGRGSTELVRHGCSSPCAVKRTALEVGVRFGGHRRLRGTLRTKTAFRRRGGTQGVRGGPRRRKSSAREHSGIVGCSLTISWLQRLATGIFCGWR
jgi:hypothetical protein